MPPPLARRQFLILAAAGGASVALGACGTGPRAKVVRPNDPAVAAADRGRTRSARTPIALTLTAAPTTIDLAGRLVNTWAYSDRGGLPELRVRKNDVIEANLVNRLPEATTIHWHGIAIRNDMDGVPDLTQRVVRPGETFAYRFTVPDPGTYFFHPHTALQLDRGLYAPLIVEDPDDPTVADVDQVLVLDDWLDGIDGTPDDALAKLRDRGGMNGSDMDGMDMGVSNKGDRMSMSGMSSRVLGGDAGDVAYPLHLINGRPAADRPTITVPPRGRVRLRLVNAGSDTAYRFAVGGHSLTVTHTDGFPVVPVEVDSLVIGMGERYDVVVTAQSGTWPVVAAAEGKSAFAGAVLRTSDAVASSAPPVDARPAELRGQLLAYTDLRPSDSARLDAAKPDRIHTVVLTGNMMAYRWGIGGKVFPDTAKLETRQGERVRLQLRNTSGMWHPMHLHGHSFALAGGDGARKDTVNLLPGRTVDVDFEADNPGQWMVHCHNTYHLESGMATVVSYIR